MSLEPYEDQSAKYQKQLKMQPRAGTNASEPDTMTVSEEDIGGPSSEGSQSASGATAVNLQREEITAPSNESSKKD